MSNTTGKTKLAHLNELLARDAAARDIPQFRSQISASGANQDWLLKAYKRHDDANPEIKELLALPFKKLAQPHEAKAVAGV